MAPTVVRPQPLSSANCWCVNGCLAVRAPISQDYQGKRLSTFSLIRRISTFSVAEVPVSTLVKVQTWASRRHQSADQAHRAGRAARLSSRICPSDDATTSRRGGVD